MYVSQENDDFASGAGVFCPQKGDDGSKKRGNQKIIVTNCHELSRFVTRIVTPGENNQ